MGRRRPSVTMSVCLFVCRHLHNNLAILVLFRATLAARTNLPLATRCLRAADVFTVNSDPHAF